MATNDTTSPPVEYSDGFRERLMSPAGSMVFDPDPGALYDEWAEEHRLGASLVMPADLDALDAMLRDAFAAGFYGTGERA